MNQQILEATGPGNGARTLNLSHRAVRAPQGALSARAPPTSPRGLGEIVAPGAVRHPGALQACRRRVECRARSFAEALSTWEMFLKPLTGRSSGGPWKVSACVLGAGRRVLRPSAACTSPAAATAELTFLPTENRGVDCCPGRGSRQAPQPGSYSGQTCYQEAPAEASGAEPEAQLERPLLQLLLKAAPCPGKPSGR